MNKNHIVMNGKCYIKTVMVVYEGEVYYQLREYDRPSKIYFGKLINKEKELYEPVSNEIYQILYDKYLKLPDVVYFNKEEWLKKLKKVTASLGIVITFLNVGAVEAYASAQGVTLETLEKTAVEDEIYLEDVEARKTGELVDFNEVTEEDVKKQSKRMLEKIAQKYSITEDIGIQALEQSTFVFRNDGEKMVSFQGQQVLLPIFDMGEKTVSKFMCSSSIAQHFFLSSRSTQQQEMYNTPLWKGIFQFIKVQSHSSHIDISMLEEAYYTGDQLKLEKVMEQSSYGKEKMKKLFLALEEDYQKYLQLITEYDKFIIYDYRKEEIPGLIYFYDQRIHEKAKEIGFSCESWDHNKESLTVAIYDQEKYNLTAVRPAAGQAGFVDMWVGIGDDSIKDTSVWNHEFTHIASFKKDEQGITYDGPFSAWPGEVYEQYNMVVNNILFPEPEYEDSSYGWINSFMSYLYFLGDGKKLTKAYFENDFDLFLNSFDENIITKEDLLFMMDFYHMSEYKNYSKEEAEKFSKLFSETYLKKIAMMGIYDKKELECYAFCYENMEAKIADVYGIVNVDMYQLLSQYSHQELEELSYYNAIRADFLNEDKFLIIPERLYYVKDEMHVSGKSR